jgi:ligand-binding sensor domain-containing protein
MTRSSNWVVALFCLSLADAALAGVNVWTTNGPAAGQIRVLAIDPANPSTVFASAWGAGVFKSSNGGESWTNVNTDLTYTTSLAIDPSAPGTVYAGTWNGGVFKSSDGGAIWRAMNTGLTMTHPAVDALVIDPSTPSTIYAGTPAGVFRSNNGGESWTAINVGLADTNVYSLAVDPSAPATLYAGTFSGIFKTIDRGESWSFSYGYNNASIVALAVDPSAPSNIYAGSAPFEWPPGGVLKSSNGGTDWAEGGLSGRQVYALAIEPSSRGTLYAGTDEGLFKSSGGAWTSIGLINPGVSALAIDPSAPATLYAGTSGAGVFKSGNGGVSWTAVNAGLIASSVQALAIDPSTPSTLFAGTRGGGVFQSRNGGGSWTPVNTGLTDYFVSALAIDPSTPATLYAGTLFPGGVFKSANGGASWTAVNAGLGNPVAPDLVGNVGALAIDPSSATLYAGVESRVFKSTSGGLSWTAVDRGLPSYSVAALAIDPSVRTTLYVGMQGGGVFKSVDGGENWAESLPRQSVYALAIDPSAPTTLYAATELGVFKSTNGGASWTQRLFALGVTALALDPSAPTTLYAGRSDYAATSGAVFKSNDGGQSWTPWNAGLTNNFVRTLAIDPSTSSRIYAGTDGGVYEYLTTTELPIDRRIFPVVGSTPGANGTFFRTSVQLNNPGSAPATGRIVFHASGTVGSDTDPALSYSLAPGQTQSIADLLPAMGVSGVGSADVEVTSGEVPVAIARVFNDAGASGTTGFTVAAMRADEAIPLGEKGVLLIPSDLTVARFNVGIRTLAEGASVNIAVTNAAGALVGTSTRVFPPNYHEQQDAPGFLRVLELPPGGSISIFANSGAAIVYGATVDNRTGDPSFQIASWGPWDY